MTSAGQKRFTKPEATTNCLAKGLWRSGTACAITIPKLGRTTCSFTTLLAQHKIFAAFRNLTCVVVWATHWSPLLQGSVRTLPKYPTLLGACSRAAAASFQ